MGAQDDASERESDDARRHRLTTLLDRTTAGDRSTSIDLDHDVAPGVGAAHSPGQSGPGGERARLGQVCALSVSEAGVSGAGVTVMGSIEAGLAGYRDQLWATCDLARQLEDLQLTAGEGPCLDAYDAGAPVLAGDLTLEQTRWMGYAPEAIAAGAAAAFSLPLQIGAVRLGTLDLHRISAGALGRPELADALMLASLATEILLELLADPDLDTGSHPNPDGDDDPAAAALPPESLGWLPDVHAEVHQASGMVAARENTGVGEALLRLRAYAFAHGEPIHQVARRIIERDLVLDDRGLSRDEGPEGPGTETER